MLPRREQSDDRSCHGRTLRQLEVRPEGLLEHHLAEDPPFGDLAQEELDEDGELVRVLEEARRGREVRRPAADGLQERRVRRGVVELDRADAACAVRPSQGQLVGPPLGRRRRASTRTRLAVPVRREKGRPTHRRSSTTSRAGCSGQSPLGTASWTRGGRPVRTGRGRRSCAAGAGGASPGGRRRVAGRPCAAPRGACCEGWGPRGRQCGREGGRAGQEEGRREGPHGRRAAVSSPDTSWRRTQ